MDEIIRRRRKGSKKLPTCQDSILAPLPLFQYLCANIRLEYGVMVALQVLVLSVEVRIPVLQLLILESTSVSPRCSLVSADLRQYRHPKISPLSNTDISQL